MAEQQNREARRAAAQGRDNVVNEPKRPINRRVAEVEEELPVSPLSMTSIRQNLLHGVGAKIVLGLLIFIFAIAGALFSARPPAGIDGTTISRDGSATVARLGSDSITRDRYERMLAQTIGFQEQYGQKTGPLEYFSQAQNTMKTMTDEAAIYQAAIAAGITATDEDIDKEIERLIKEQIDSQKNPDPAAFRRQVEAKYPNGEAGMREELQKNFDRELVARSLVAKKFEEQAKEANKVTEDDYKRSVTKLGLRQIVIRPEQPGPTVKEYAKAQEANGVKAVKAAEELAATLKGKKGRDLVVAFAAAARAKSADAATKNKGGVVGEKLPSELPIDAGARLALQNAKEDLVGPIQDQTTKDVYLFLVENRRPELPKDYAKKKAELIKNFETQSDNDAWQKKQDGIKKAVQPEVVDPGLIAYKTQTEKLYAAPEAEKAALRTEILANYEQALGSANPLEKGAIRYQMAQVYRDAGDKAKALTALQEAGKLSTSAQLQLELARALRDAGQKKEALAKLTEISKQMDDSPSAPSMFGSNPDDAIRFQLATEFDLMGDKKHAAAERAKVKPAAPGGMGGMGGMGGNITIPGR